jgi:hypothetical protein
MRLLPSARHPRLGVKPQRADFEHFVRFALRRSILYSRLPAQIVIWSLCLKRAMFPCHFVLRVLTSSSYSAVQPVDNAERQCRNSAAKLAIRTDRSLQPAVTGAADANSGSMRRLRPVPTQVRYVNRYYA